MKRQTKAAREEQQAWSRFLYAVETEMLKHNEFLTEWAKSIRLPDLPHFAELDSAVDNLWNRGVR